MIYNNITKGRNVNIRPVLNQSHPVKVYVSLYLVYIQEFDEVKGKLGLTALVYVHWWIFRNVGFARDFQIICSSPMNITVVHNTFDRVILVNIICSSLMCILNIFVFLLPADSGERVGYAITVLLAIAVFLTISSDSLPATSNPRISNSFSTICWKQEHKYV
jgi:hypothetical protein